MQRTEMTDVIRLEVGEPDFNTPDYILEAVKADLDDGRYTHYTPVAGYPDLRRALAVAIHDDTGLTVDPEGEVVVTVGGASALYTAIMAVVDPGDEVLVPDPGYPQYTQQVLLAGGTPVFYGLREANGFQPDLAELRSLITARSKMLILNSPHNPTGGTISNETQASIAALAQERDLLVLADDVYHALMYDGAYRSIAALPGMFERTVTINSFSKTYAMTGWRLGYAFGPQPIIWEMVKLQSFILSCPTSVSQRAALAALTQSRATEEMVAEYRRRRDWLVAALNDLPGFRCHRPAGAFYVFPNISAFGLSSEEFCARLLQATHVTSVPGSAFGPTGEGHLRMSYATSMESLQTAVERIRAALPGLVSG